MASTVTPAPDTASTSKKNRVFPVLILVALGALVWAGKTYIYGLSHQTTDNAQVDGSSVSERRCISRAHRRKVCASIANTL